MTGEEGLHLLIADQFSTLSLLKPFLDGGAGFLVKFFGLFAFCGKNEKDLGSLFVMRANLA